MTDEVKLEKLYLNGDQAERRKSDQITNIDSEYFYVRKSCNENRIAILCFNLFEANFQIINKYCKLEFLL